MKKITLKRIFKAVIIMLAFSFISYSQDVAICGWDGSGSTNGAGDEFSFVLLRNYSAGEIIYFTEDEYSDFSNNFNNGEGHIAFTVPSGGLNANEVISILDSGSDNFTVQCISGGSATLVSGSGGWSFSNADEIYAYSASNNASPWNSVTEIHSFAWGSNIVPPSDQNPSNDYPNSIIIAFNIGGGAGTNANFNDSARNNTTLTSLQNGANWTQSTGGLTLSCTNFTNNTLNANDYYSLNDVGIYPNPARDFITINMANNINLSSAILYDINGREIGNYNLDNMRLEKRIIIKDLNLGVYILAIEGNNNTIIKRIIKQ